MEVDLNSQSRAWPVKLTCLQEIVAPDKDDPLTVKLRNEAHFAGIFANGVAFSHEDEV